MVDRHTQKQSYPLRMAPELRERLEVEAKQNNRSVNAEIVARLEQSFSTVPAAVDLAERLGLIGELKRMATLLMEMHAEKAEILSVALEMINASQKKVPVKGDPEFIMLAHKMSAACTSKWDRETVTEPTLSAPTGTNPLKKNKKT